MTAAISRKNWPTALRHIGPTMSGCRAQKARPGRDRKRGEDPSRQAALGRQRADEAPDVVTLADSQDDHVEYLGGVSAGRAQKLSQHRDLLELAARHPDRNLADRFLERECRAARR